MKKPLSILTLSLATIIGGLNLASPVSAEVVVLKYETSYTIDELLQTGVEINGILNEQCPDGGSLCRSAIYQELLRSSDEKYSIWNSFASYSLVVTSFNPDEGIFEVLYHEKSNSTIWGPLSDDYSNLIKNLKLGWSEPDYTRPVNSGPRELPSDETSSPEGYHFIYSHTDTEEPGWFLPNTKFTIVSDDHSLASTNDGYLQYNFSSEKSGNAFGTISISSCLNSPNYLPGDECRAVFSKRSSLSYVPYRNGKVVAPNYILGEEVPTDSDPSVTNPAPSDTAEQPADPTDSDYIDNTNQDDANQTDVSQDDVINNSVNQDTEQTDIGNNITNSSDANNQYALGESMNHMMLSSAEVEKTNTYETSVATVTSASGLAKTLSTVYTDLSRSAASQSDDGESASSDSVEERTEDIQNANSASEDNYSTPLGGEETAAIGNGDSIWWLIVPIAICGVGTLLWLYLKKIRRKTN